MIFASEKDERFYLGESTQPLAGKGVFAARDIKAGEVIEVIGVAVEKGSVADICTAYADPFKFASDYEGSYTHHIIPLGYAGMVNHANRKESQNVEIRHAERGGERVSVYYFLRDVPKGQEVLGDYGEGWRLMADWSSEVNESVDSDEEMQWASFLERDLYNLGSLKRPKEIDAKHK